MRWSVIAVVLALLICLSGCGEKEEAIVGQWEDEEGRIFIIDPDGLIFDLWTNSQGDYITPVGFLEDGTPTTRNKWYKENGEYHWKLDQYFEDHPDGFDWVVEISGDVMIVEDSFFVETLHRLEEPIPRSEVYWSTIDRENSAYVTHSLDELDK